MFEKSTKPPYFWPIGVLALGAANSASLQIAIVDRHVAAMCPLLNGKEYVPEVAQVGVQKATEELWLIRYTGQSFRDYECVSKPPGLINALSVAR